MTTPVVLSVISDDRPGVVEKLSEVLARHEGNWTESSMMSLGGKFAGILLASVPRDSAGSLIEELQGLQSGGLRITAEMASATAEHQPVTEVTLDLIGQDRPGIVKDVTRILASHHVNVQELETHCQSASMSGETLFSRPCANRAVGKHLHRRASCGAGSAGE